MPAESARLNRRLSRRDRWFLGLLAAAALVASAVGLAVLGHSQRPAADCIEFSHPNFTGGATYRYCGTRALGLCRDSPVLAPALVTQCLRIGVRRRAPG